MKVSEIIKNSTITTFSFYRQGFLYYRIVVSGENTDQPYVFPIEIEDLGTATVSLREKPITLMRYIRKAVEGDMFVKCK